LRKASLHTPIERWNFPYSFVAPFAVKRLMKRFHFVFLIIQGKPERNSHRNEYISRTFRWRRSFDCFSCGIKRFSLSDDESQALWSFSTRELLRRDKFQVLILENAFDDDGKREEKAELNLKRD
jgi:hypothetical protein